MNGGIKGSYFTFGLFIFLITSLILIAIKPIYGQPTSAITPCDPKNLTGKWRANDGGTYFVRQLGNEFWWFGTSRLQEGTIFSNVFHGKIDLNFPPPSGSPHIFGDWQDVPLGDTRGSGKLSIKIDPSGQKLTKIGMSGAFGGSEWIKNCRTPSDIIKAPPQLPKIGK